MRNGDYDYPGVLRQFLFEVNWMEPPLFHNNKDRTLRFDLESKPETESAELIQNIFDDLFFERGDMIVLFYGTKTFRWSEGKTYFRKFSLKRVFKSKYETRREDPAGEGYYVVACVTKRNCFYLKKYLVDYLCDRQKCQMAFISLKKYAALQLYDSRGFDFLSEDKDFLKRIYYKYEADIIEYNRQEIKDALGITER